MTTIGLPEVVSSIAVIGNNNGFTHFGNRIHENNMRACSHVNLVSMHISRLPSCNYY